MDDAVTKTSYNQYMVCQEILAAPLSLMTGENLNNEDGNDMNEDKDEKKDKHELLPSAKYISQ